MNNRFFSIAGFSLLFAYLLSFLFEGQVLYSMLAYNDVLGSSYILVAIIAHFAGLSTSGFFVKAAKTAKYTMLISMSVCLMATVPFYFPHPSLGSGLIVSGYAGGRAVASWGYFLRPLHQKSAN